MRDCFKNETSAKQPCVSFVGINIWIGKLKELKDCKTLHNTKQAFPSAYSILDYVYMCIVWIKYVKCKKKKKSLKYILYFSINLAYTGLCYVAFHFCVFAHFKKRKTSDVIFIPWMSKMTKKWTKTSLFEFILFFKIIQFPIVLLHTQPMLTNNNVLPCWETRLQNLRQKEILVCVLI